MNEADKQKLERAIVYLSKAMLYFEAMSLDAPSEIEDIYIQIETARANMTKLIEEKA